MIPLYAAQMSTRAVPDKHPDIHVSHYRHIDDLTVCSIGFGSRLGDADDETDRKIINAVSTYFRLGGNLIDTAIVDRNQRSEKAIGEGLARELSTGKISRREIVLSTKGGFLTKDERESHIDSGVVSEKEIAGGIHCMSPSFLRRQLQKSRQNLQVETIDLYYLHNPEAEAPYVARDELMNRIREAIGFLEEAASDGFIRRYGISTWSAFRVPEGETDHLELAELVSMAEEVAGSRHHFRAIQVPYNTAMPSAAFKTTQRVYGSGVSILEAAHELGIDVIVSSPLMQGHLASELSPAFHTAFPRFRSDAQRALDFVLSTPWVTSAVVGMKESNHIEENMRILRDPALTSLQWAAEVDQLQDLT